MDETDVKILGKLLSDARLSYRRIADEIGVSPPTVLARVKKLENDSVIKFYSAVLDHEKLGYDLTAIIEVISQVSLNRPLLLPSSKSLIKIFRYRSFLIFYMFVESIRTYI